MKLNSLGMAALLALSLVVVSGCDQVEKSAQQVLGKATESAKQAIDDNPSRFLFHLIRSEARLEGHHDHTTK